MGAGDRRAVDGQWPVPGQWQHGATGSKGTGRNPGWDMGSPGMVQQAAARGVGTQPLHLPTFGPSACIGGSNRKLGLKDPVGGSIWMSSYCRAWRSGWRAD